MQPSQGSLTYEAEGTEGGRYHSRRLHVPGATSGLTIGRGYDMRFRSANTVRQDLIRAGVAAHLAEAISKGAGLTGSTAEAFISRHQLSNFEITPEAQLKLFQMTYAHQAREAERVCTKSDIAAKYGTCDWSKLHPALQEVVIDLKFRGDYTPAVRTRIQHTISKNDPQRFLDLLSDRAFWPGVPADRQRRRIEYLRKGVTCRNCRVRTSTTVRKWFQRTEFSLDGARDRGRTGTTY
jgi:hypothetical protein